MIGFAAAALLILCHETQQSPSLKIVTMIVPCVLAAAVATRVPAVVAVPVQTGPVASIHELVPAFSHANATQHTC